MIHSLSLFIVLVACRAATAAGPAPPSGIAGLAAAFLHDAAVAVAAGLLLSWVRPRALGWTLYGLTTAYLAVNVPIVLSISGTLTAPMLRAARGPLAGSIAHHATPLNLALAGAVAAAAIAAPLVLRRLPSRRLAPTWWALAVGAALAWPVAAPGSPAAGGRERNAVTALVRSLLPRAPEAMAGTAGQWTRGPVAGEARRAGSSLARLRGLAAGRSVVMTVLESTGAEYLGLHGAAPDPMPRLTRLAGSAMVFEQAYCTYPESIKSLMATLASVFPALDVPAEAYGGVSVPALPGVLRQAGYATALFHAGRFGYLGMDAVVSGRGFDVLEDAGDIGGERESSFGVDEASVVRRALAWIDGLPPEKPFLLVYLPIAGHHPYASPGPRPFRETGDRDAYLNDLHVADAALGALVDGLRSRGRWQNTVLAAFGDHGEAFGQHDGNFGHSLALHEENIRVPFLLALPGLVGSQLRVRDPASTIDAAPTILDLLGMEAPAEFQGASLLGPGSRLALFFADYDRGLLGLRDGRWKCVHELETARTALFDLEADPGESRDLAAAFPGRAEAYARHLRGWCAAQRQRVEAARRAVASES